MTLGKSNQPSSSCEVSGMILAVRSNLSNCFLAWKKKRFQDNNGIRTHDLRDTGAFLYQLSYEALRCCD